MSSADVAEAHARDLEAQGKHEVRYLRYWGNEEKGKVFCLALHHMREPRCDAGSYRQGRSAASDVPTGALLLRRP